MFSLTFAAVHLFPLGKRFKTIEEKADWHSHTLLCIYRFLRAILKLSNSENEQAPKRGMTILGKYLHLPSRPFVSWLLTSYCKAHPQSLNEISVFQVLKLFNSDIFFNFLKKITIKYVIN